MIRDGDATELIGDSILGGPADGGGAVFSVYSTRSTKLRRARPLVQAPPIVACPPRLRRRPWPEHRDPIERHPPGPCGLPSERSGLVNPARIPLLLHFAFTGPLTVPWCQVEMSCALIS